MGIITDPSKPLDIVGFQEFTNVQRALFKQKVPGYELYPSSLKARTGENAIGWDSTKFRLVEGGMMPNLQYFAPGNSLDAPWVKLQDISEGPSSGQQFYVLNTHDPAGPGYAKKRWENAKQHVIFINSLRSSGLPIFMTGDFNSGFNRRSDNNITYLNRDENLTYCIMTKEGYIQNAFDIYEEREVKCPNPGNDNSVDHIYLSDGVLVGKYYKLAAGVNKNGSDNHDTHIAEVTIPGKDTPGEDLGSWKGDPSAQGFQWPAKAGRISNCWQKPGHAGIDIATGTEGKSVYAAKAGTVVMSGNSGDSGNVVMIKHTGGLWSNYQHNSKLLVSVGDTVRIGQEIAKSGNTGYSTGPHIHFGITDAQTLSSSTGTNSLNPFLFLPNKPPAIEGVSCR